MRERANNSLHWSAPFGIVSHKSSARGTHIAPDASGKIVCVVSDNTPTQSARILHNSWRVCTVSHPELISYDCQKSVFAGPGQSQRLPRPNKLLQHRRTWSLGHNHREYGALCLTLKRRHPTLKRRPGHNRRVGACASLRRLSCWRKALPAMLLPADTCIANHVIHNMKAYCERVRGNPLSNVCSAPNPQAAPWQLPRASCSHCLFDHRQRNCTCAAWAELPIWFLQTTCGPNRSFPSGSFGLAQLVSLTSNSNTKQCPTVSC